LTTYKGIWFIGLAGSGKTFASKYISKKMSNTFVLDGDEVRKYISTDLGYELKDRSVQINRLFGIAKIILKNNYIPIISSVYMNNIISGQLDLEGIALIKIERDYEDLVKIRKIYKKDKNVIGKDLDIENIFCKKIFNNGTEDFIHKINDIIK
tara:strand:- start:499 stop:957 length:459 start_codon:yes stop_codon:yes gene_type:complete